MSTGTEGSVDLPEPPEPEPIAPQKGSGADTVRASQAQVISSPPGPVEGEGDKAPPPSAAEEDGVQKVEEGGEAEIRLSKENGHSGSKKSERPEEFSGKRQRKGSMFEERRDTAKNPDGDLRDTLAEFFSSAPRETTEGGTVLKPLRRPKLIYENTFRMSSKFPFSPTRVKSMMGPIMEDMFMGYKYNSKTSAHKATEVAEKIRRNVLAFRFDRYKIVVLVTISPLNRQGFHNGFRCLWDANRDSYAFEIVRNPSIFAIAVVYGIYFE